MEIVGILTVGLEIAGFQIKTKNGQLKKLSYKKTIELATQGRLKGVGVTTILGVDYLTGIDYSQLINTPLKLTSGEIKGRNTDSSGEVRYTVEVDGKNEQFTAEDTWGYTASGAFINGEAGLLEIGNGKFLKTM